MPRVFCICVIEPLPEEEEADLSMRFFTCHKNLDVDRMIGDRRSRNFVEGTIPGASQCLPPALLLADLELRPFLDKICIYFLIGRIFTIT